MSFKQAKRAIQNIVELMMQDESTLLGLTNLRCHDQYTHNHSVNVSLLAMALGNRAGYPKVELADLGLSALFHDVGKCAISLDLLNKPGEFTQDEWAIMRSHPTEGVFTLVKSRGINNVPARMAAASFEHHMNYDFSGYPKLKRPLDTVGCEPDHYDRRLLRCDDLVAGLSPGTDVAVECAQIHVRQERAIL